MHLYLLRHGIAVEPGTAGYTHDADRPLTPEGRRKLSQAAEALSRLEVEFDLILTSPYVRARQTAEIITKGLHSKQRIECSETLTPSGSVRRLIEHLNQLDPQPETVLLVGHEPYLSQLVSWLVSGETGFAVVMKKGALCKLSAESLRNGRCASLEWLVTPKLLGLKR